MTSPLPAAAEDVRFGLVPGGGTQSVPGGGGGGPGGIGGIGRLPGGGPTIPPGPIGPPGGVPRLPIGGTPGGGTNGRIAPPGSPPIFDGIGPGPMGELPIGFGPIPGGPHGADGPSVHGSGGPWFWPPRGGDRTNGLFT